MLDEFIEEQICVKDVEITEDEKKIREQGFLGFVIGLVLSLISLDIIGIFVHSSTYYFGYRKNRTGWLTFLMVYIFLTMVLYIVLIIVAINLIISVFDSFRGEVPTTLWLGTFMVGVAGIIVLSLLAYKAWFFRLTAKLRKFAKKIQSHNEKQITV